MKYDFDCSYYRFHEIEIQRAERLHITHVGQQQGRGEGEGLLRFELGIYMCVRLLDPR